MAYQNRHLPEDYYEVSSQSMQARVTENPDLVYQSITVSADQQTARPVPQPTGNTQSSKKRLSKLQIVVITAIILNFALAITSIAIMLLKRNEISEQHQKLQSKHNAIESSIKDARRKLSENITLVEEREIRNHESYEEMLEDLKQLFTESLVLAEERETRHNATYEKIMKVHIDGSSAYRRSYVNMPATSKLKVEFLSIRRARKEWRQRVTNLEERSTWHHLSNGYFYKIFENKVSYQEAKASCQEKGARLVTEGVRNVEMRAETKRLIKMKDQDVWIGLNDLVTEGDWTWEDGVDGPIEWMPNEPNNQGPGEDCGHYHLATDWVVNDIPCDRKFMYMCEKTN